MNSYDRKNPFLSQIQERFLLSHPSSTKKTFHLSLSLQNSSIRYQPGDTVAILPSNDPKDVETLLQVLHSTGQERVRLEDRSISLYDFFLEKANLQKPHPALLKAIAAIPTDSAWPIDLLRQYPLPESLSIQDIPRLFLPLLPRLYSIASSPLLYPNELHLIITLIQYERHGIPCKGVATHFLCENAQVLHTPIPMYIQHSAHFCLPENSDIPIILVSAGTGIAPFRSFLQQREVSQSRGRNWLFFGERQHHSDFYYRDFFERLEREGKLRLDLAFSRDQPEKIYVQHRLWEKRKDVWAWLNEGAYFYVCGDARHMAKDVLATLIQIVSTEGNMSQEAAKEFVKTLRSQKCYRSDVY